MSTLVFNRASFAPADDAEGETIVVAFSYDDAGTALAGTARLLRTVRDGRPEYLLMPSRWTDDLALADAIRDYAIVADQTRKPGQDTVRLRLEMQLHGTVGDGGDLTGD